jgi:hypothetical protein
MQHCVTISGSENKKGPTLVVIPEITELLECQFVLESLCSTTTVILLKIMTCVHSHIFL